MVTVVVDEADIPAVTLCEIGACGPAGPLVDPMPAGTPCGDGPECDGTGNCLGCVNIGDCTASAPCRVADCTAGECIESLADQGHTCSIDGGLQNGVCSVDGACLCTEDSQCGITTPCVTRSCEMGACVETPHTGMACNSGFGVCSEEGACVLCIDDSQCAADGACVDSFCTPAHTCDTAPVATGDSCLPPAEGFCTAAGACVACFDDVDCPATADSCSELFCTNHNCLLAVEANGAPCPDGSPGVCNFGVCSECSSSANCLSITPPDGHPG